MEPRTTIEDGPPCPNVAAEPEPADGASLEDVSGKLDAILAALGIDYGKDEDGTD